MPPQLLTHLPDIIARSGGGGSGGSGGDGGSIFIFLGYVPMHYVGRFLRKTGKNPVASVLQQGIGWFVAVVYAIIWVFLWRGLGFVVAIAALTGMGAGLYGWFSKLKQSKLVKGKLSAAAQNDAAWDETKLTEYAKGVFLRYQADWSNLSTESMRAYLTPAYHYHASLLMYALQLLGRKNPMENIQIDQATITDLHDNPDNTQDTVTVGFTASATDQLVDTRSSQTIFICKSTFTEYWQFTRSGSTWLLAGIQQATASEWSRNSLIEQFAQSHGYYYSVDMGWLLIPAAGQFFGSAKFGTSDINNHVIGMYNQQVLVQIYTYVPKPENSKSYLIAQMNLPSKAYGQIVVRRKKMLQLFGIRGLEKVSTEWTEFNGKYEVFAAAPEQATSFELLNPTFMERLAAAPFEINLEVVDNVVYFYTDERKADAANYEAMLAVLYDAFKEMRL